MIILLAMLLNLFSENIIDFELVMAAQYGGYVISVSAIAIYRKVENVFAADALLCIKIKEFWQL